MLRIVLLAVISWQADGNQLVIFVARHAGKQIGRIPRAVSLLTSGTREGCYDAEQVEEAAEVNFPRQYRNIRRPWIYPGSSAKLYTSQNLQYTWLWIKSLGVRGLNEITVSFGFFFKSANFQKLSPHT
ncbi:unnamed protein product [Gongylonema pulchrum]|uniref:Secreted protein n=1 Tax=Gongylonema pulchrum TaxID=637853 RepID=A0A183EN69_9BILA|nr:unnamed protein product [Gongylonema pulchrum]